MAPVILRTFVHCLGCARRIRRAIKNYLGVEEVWVSVDTGLVVVAGTNLDASLLRWRVQSKIRKYRMVPQLGPPAYAQPPPAAPYPYTAAALGWVPDPPQHLLQYVPVELLHARRQYMPNEAPLWLNDDDPNGCCSVQ